jgi:endonuclease G
MKLRNKRFRVVRRFRVLLLLVLLYLCGTVGYYFLPWQVRKPVYMLSPKLNRVLRLRGFKIVEGWDGLGLWGRDRRAAIEPGHRGDHAYGGYPACGRELTLLENEGYVVGYSEPLRNPLWVAYRIFDVPSLESGKRPGFRIDYRTESRVSQKAYSGSGYDRGHMAPNYAIATRHGPDGQRETFLMSNIIPQRPHVNRHIWKDLEMRVAKRYGRYFGEVWVVTGPVFKEPVKRLSSGVAIPAAYYKIMVDETGGKLRAKAFLVAGNCPPYTRIKTRLVSIDDLEALTGLDFFPDLSEETQSALESKPAGRLWPWVGAALRHR